MSKRLGGGVSSAHSLASDTSEGAHCCVRHKGGKESAISPAGSNARSSRAAARARNQSAAGSASSRSASVPKEVVTTRLYKCGRLIETDPSNLRPSAPQLCMLIYSDDDKKDLDAVDDDEDYVEKNFTPMSGIPVFLVVRSLQIHHTCLQRRQRKLGQDLRRRGGNGSTVIGIRQQRTHMKRIFLLRLHHLVSFKITLATSVQQYDWWCWLSHRDCLLVTYSNWRRPSWFALLRRQTSGLLRSPSWKAVT